MFGRLSHEELGSAAIDAAVSASCLPTDQRGVARPFGAGCDIGAYEYDIVDETPPVITVPTSVIENATSPAGASVSYTASADDEVDGAVDVECSPQSGSLFPIQDTTLVTCSATDRAGNTAGASFTVHVKGAGKQLDDLIDQVDGIGPGSGLAAKLTEAKSALVAGNKGAACNKLAAFANQARSQSGKTLTPTEAAEFVVTANRIGSDPA